MPLLNEYSERFTGRGLEMAEKVLDQLCKTDLIADDHYPMYESQLSTIVVMNYLGRANAEDRATAAVVVGIELNTICNILNIPLWQGGFDWDYYVINKNNPGLEVGKVLSEHVYKSKLTMANLSIPVYMIDWLNMKKGNIPKIVEAVDFSFLPDFRGLFAVSCIMSGEIYSTLSAENKWNSNSGNRRVLKVDL